MKVFVPFVQKNEELWRDNADAHGQMEAAPAHPQATTINVEFFGLDRELRTNEVMH